MFAIALKKNPKPDSSGHTHTHTEQSWDPNPRSVLPQSPLQRAALPAPSIPKGEPNHTVQPARVREGWGRVLKAEHPDLPPPLPLPSKSNHPSTETRSSPQTYPCPPASSLQPYTDFQRNKRASLYGLFSSQQSDREQAQRCTVPQQAILQVRVPQLEA